MFATVFLRLLPFFVVAGALFGVNLPSARADTAELGTLDRIRAAGAIHLGYRASSVPFSYVADGQTMGYSHELALRVVDAVRRHLNLPDLPVRLVPITSKNRALLIENGRIDLECGSTTHSREREAGADFSTTIFVAGIRLLTRKDSGIRDFDDLAGRLVVTTAGTTSERLLRRRVRTDGVMLVTAGDHADSFAVFQAGRADAFVMDDVILFAELAKAETPKDWIVTGTPQAFQVYACMMKKGDEAFKRVVDAALAETMTSGEAERLYARWFTQPIPPHGLNIGLPLSDAMRALYAAPNDKPLQ